MEDIKRRLEDIEQRLSRIEDLLAEKEEPVDLGGMEIDEEPMFIFQPLEGDELVESTKPLHGRLRTAAAHNLKTKPLAASITVTNLLGWAGAMALVLAATYLVKLGVDAGWLTPERRMVGAVLGGLVLIG